MDKIIELKDINKTYGNNFSYVKALDNISLDINKGEFVSIIGTSGSGKSTLMNILGCLDTADSGKYILDDMEINNCTDSMLSEIRNQKIGFIFQSFNLIPSMNAIENVELPLIYRNISAGKRRKTAAACRNSKSHRFTAANNSC